MNEPKRVKSNRLFNLKNILVMGAVLGVMIPFIVIEEWKATELIKKSSMLDRWYHLLLASLCFIQVLRP